MTIGDDDFESLTGAPEADAPAADKDTGKDKLETDAVLEDDEIEGLDAGFPDLPGLDEDEETDKPAAADDDDDESGKDEDDADDDEIDPSVPADLVDIRSPEVRDRIMRERRLKDEAVSLAEERLTAMRNDAMDRVAKVHTMRIGAIRGWGKNLIDAAEAVIETQRDRMIAARESGDAKAEFAAQEQVAKWEKIRDGVRPHISRAEDDAKKLEAWQKGFDPKAKVPLYSEEDRERQTERQPETSAEAKPPELAVKWLGKNPWFNDDENEDVRGFAMGVERKLKAAGLKPDDPRLYRGIAKKIAQTFPHLKVMDLDGKRVAGSERKPERVAGAEAGVSGHAGTPSGKRGQNGALRPEEVKRMKRYGMDPKDPAVVAEWRRNHPLPKAGSSDRRRIA